MSKTLKYVKGDATAPVSTSDIRLIIHVVNNCKAWGKGFVLALSKRDPTPEKFFRSWSNGKLQNVAPYELGNIQICPFAEEGLYVINMVGQEGIKVVNGIPPVRYDAIDSCLAKVRAFVEDQKSATGKSVSVHAPRFGAGLSGGKWELIEKLIIDNLCSYDIDVTVYDLP
jgi:O-acetyl-ADP-ribose deacetylase (regulator of RNase III)